MGGVGYIECMLEVQIMPIWPQILMPAVISSEHINPLHKKSYMSFSLLAQFLLIVLFSIETEKDVLAGYACA